MRIIQGLYVILPQKSKKYASNSQNYMTKPRPVWMGLCCWGMYCLIQGDLVADGEHDDGIAGLAVGLCHAVVANDVVVGI